MLEIISCQDVFSIIYYTLNESESNTAFLEHFNTLMYYVVMIDILPDFMFLILIWSVNAI
jgi:uncharacterized membrane protein YkvA (DUF1232 family)